MSENINPHWTEEFRPMTVAETILPRKLKEIFGFYVKEASETNRPPNLLLEGTSGLGKTTVAKAMLAEIDADYIEINASKDSTKQVLKKNITSFATSISLAGKHKFVLMDEADYMSSNLQASLRNDMEAFSGNCGFIFTCNEPTKIIPAIHSRCSSIQFEIPSEEKEDLKSEFVSRAKSILKDKRVKFEKGIIEKFVDAYYPDWRKCLNELQSYSATGTIDKGILPSSLGRSVSDLVEKGVLNGDFVFISDWVEQNLKGKPEGFYARFLSEMSPRVKPSSLRGLIRTVNQYQKSDNDLTVNVLGMIDELLDEVDFA